MHLGWISSFYWQFKNRNRLTCVWLCVFQTYYMGSINDAVLWGLGVPPLRREGKRGLLPSGKPGPCWSGPLLTWCWSVACGTESKDTGPSQRKPHPQARENGPFVVVTFIKEAPDSLGSPLTWLPSSYLEPVLCVACDVFCIAFCFKIV